MILPNNINPKNTIYYNSALIIKKMKVCDNKDFMNIYKILSKEINITLKLYLLCIDWLYLVNVIKIGIGGEIELCN